MKTFQKVLLMALALTFFVIITPAIGVTAYPEKPVTILVAFSAGGATDLITRVIANAVKPYFPQPFLIINRAGGAGTIGAVEVFHAKPDGYTIGNLSTSTLTMQPHRRTDLAYKKPDDFGFVLKLAYQPFMLFNRSDGQLRTLQQFMEFAKANPGKLRVGTSGEGGILHINLALLMEKAGVNFTHVPFSGDAEAVTAVLGGHVESAIAAPASIVAQFQAGKIKVLGTFETRRNILFPETPTFLEVGYDVNITSSTYIMVPKKTPDSVIRILHNVFKKGMEEQSFKDYIKKSGWVADYKDPIDMKKELDGYYSLFGEIFLKLKLK